MSDAAAVSCSYFLWKQVFPVKAENVVSARREINECAISIAFPLGKRLNTGTSSVGIFAFLPTAMVTNFPFIVQADFILASSREVINLDNKWNMGILDHVPSCFVGALITCMKSIETDEIFTIDQVLRFLPVQKSPYNELNGVRNVIETILPKKYIVPCESFSNEKIKFCKPTEAMRVFPKFRNILHRVLGSSARLNKISSQRRCIVHNSVDCRDFDQVWDFLGLPPVGDCNGWYGKCIRVCCLISRASTDMYVELLCFLAENWRCFPLKSVDGIPLLKYITYNGEIMLCSLSQIRSESLRVHLIWDDEKHPWLNKWNLALGCPSSTFFFPDDVVSAILKHGRQHILKTWLTSVQVNVVVTDVYGYSSRICHLFKTSKDPRHIVVLSHLLYHSVLKNYIRVFDVSNILSTLPVVDAQGNVVPCTNTLVPAAGSRWIKLFGSDNAYTADTKYVVLGEVYAEPAEIAGECTPEKKLLEFFEKYSKTCDLPDLFPKDASLQVASTQLTSDQALLLLNWIRNLRAKKHDFPVKFIDSLRKGKWMKTCFGFKAPHRCFLCDGTEISTLPEIGKTLKVLSFIDEEYYGNQIISFKHELMSIGVHMKSEGMYKLIVDHLKHFASSLMSRNCAISILKFIRYLKDNNKLNEELLKTLKEGKWLKTIKGCTTPAGSFYLASNLAEVVTQISDLQVADNSYYGSQLGGFVEELKVLGVLVDLLDVYRLLPMHFRFPEDDSPMVKDSVFLLLECIQHLGPTAMDLIQIAKSQPWIKTNSGFKFPSEVLLSDGAWGYVLDVVTLPIIDEAFYGSRIKSYKGELEALGVTVDIDGVISMLSDQVKLLSASNKLTGANVISLLKCIKYMGYSRPSLLISIRFYLSERKWLKTSHGYKSGPDCILYNSSEWGPVSRFVDLPFIEDVFYDFKLYSFKDELKMLGVVVNFSEGAQFVARGLKLPEEPTLITPKFALLLLQCATHLQQSNKSENQSVVEGFLLKLKGNKWIKTYIGYRYPEESLLFNPDWECRLKYHDAPFIDESFYGTLSSLEKDGLKAIGVKLDVDGICYIISQTLYSHTQTCVILRIYNFLNSMRWIPKQADEFDSQLWVPDQQISDGGKWVSSRVSVLHDDDHLFESRMHVLDKYYSVELLSYFSTAFGVAPRPSRDDYIKLWNECASGEHHMSHAELNSFWGYILKNWDMEMEWTLKTKIILLPASTNSGTVKFVNKEELFIPDDLQLKQSFAKASITPLFVWFPPNGLSSVSPTKLSKIYRKTGVRKISESVKLDPSQLGNCKLEKMDLTRGLVGKALVKIILGFLASPFVNMSMAERHKAAKSVIDISVFGTEEPITVRYGLYLLSLKRELSVDIRRMVLWEKNLRRLIVHKPSWEDGKKNIEFVTAFARAISDAVLPGTDLADRLCYLIKMAFAFEFREGDVDFLLVTENLELPPEDKDFFDNTFTCLKRADSLSFESGKKPCARKRIKVTRH